VELSNQTNPEISGILKENFDMLLVVGAEIRKATLGRSCNQESYLPNSSLGMGCMEERHLITEP